MADTEDDDPAWLLAGGDGVQSRTIAFPYSSSSESVSNSILGLLVVGGLVAIVDALSGR